MFTPHDEGELLCAHIMLTIDVKFNFILDRFFTVFLTIYFSCTLLSHYFLTRTWMAIKKNMYNHRSHTPSLVATCTQRSNLSNHAQHTRKYMAKRETFTPAKAWAKKFQYRHQRQCCVHVRKTNRWGRETQPRNTGVEAGEGVSGSKRTGEEGKVKLKVT